VSLPSGAGVLRLEDGSAVVTADVTKSDGWTSALDQTFRPALVPTEQETCVVGGLLPPHAVSVEIVDLRGERVRGEVANGAYIAALDERDEGADPIVCCRDSAGAPVERPRRAGHLGVPVSDACDPCPACEALDFEEYVPDTAGRSGPVDPEGRIVPRPVVRCRVCGHEHEEPIVVHAPERAGAPEPTLTREQLMAKADAMRGEFMWKAVADGVLHQAFPIYAAAGWPARICQSGSEDDGRLTSVTVAHSRAYESAQPNSHVRPQLTITTERDDPQDPGSLERAQWALRRWAPPGDAPRPRNTSLAADTLHHQARRRRERAAALNATQRVQPVEIDGRAISSLLLTTATGGWAATLRHGELTITIAGHDLDPDSLSLAPVSEPSRRFGPPPTDP